LQIPWSAVDANRRAICASHLGRSVWSRILVVAWRCAAHSNKGRDASWLCQSREGFGHELAWCCERSRTCHCLAAYRHVDALRRKSVAPAGLCTLRSTFGRASLGSCPRKLSHSELGCGCCERPRGTSQQMSWKPLMKTGGGRRRPKRRLSMEVENSYDASCDAGDSGVALRS